jgi:hypothetical protein
VPKKAREGLCRVIFLEPADAHTTTPQMALNIDENAIKSAIKVLTPDVRRGWFVVFFAFAGKGRKEERKSELQLSPPFFGFHLTSGNSCDAVT